MIYRGEVVDVVDGAPVVNLPRRPGSPSAVLTVVAGLVAGDRVLVTDGVDGQPDLLAVIGLLA